MNVGPFIILRRLTLTGDTQAAVMKGDFDILFPHAGKFDAHDEVLLVLVQIERGSPAAQQLSWPSCQGNLEKSVEFVLANQTTGLPPAIHNSVVCAIESSSCYSF